MTWLLLICAGLMEVAMAISLKGSHGFSRLWPSIAFLVFGGLSFLLLSRTLRGLEVGTAYAVWTGIGAAGTAILGMMLLGESRSAARLLSLALLITGIVGLKLTGEG
jgi:quaternary ammonium compound-resistance protein SugE